MARFLIASILLMAAGFTWSGCASTEHTSFDDLFPDAAGVGGGAGGNAPGSCSPMYCTDIGFGTPCCVTPNGPCGTDTGNGCVGGAGGQDAG